MGLQVGVDCTARWRGKTLRCALGRTGISATKREGDGATPAGAFPLRGVLYRADRGTAPATILPAEAIARDAGWCDDPADPNYNRRVRLPYPARAEVLWRADHLYDVIGLIGFNDSPVVPGRGSAIFLHLAQPDFAPTEGCIALARDDLLSVLSGWRADDRVIVEAP